MDQSIEAVLTAFCQGQCSREDTLRALLGYPAWQLSLDIAGQPEIVPSDDGTPFVIAESVVNEGQMIDGRSLVRDIVPEGGGIVFDPDETWAVLFKPEDLPDLKRWAQIVDLEEALLNPAPGQAHTLVNGPWWGVVTPGSDYLSVYRDRHREGVSEFSLNAVTLLTAPDAVRTFTVTDRHRNLEVVELGPALWQALASRTDYDGIRVNPCTPRYRLLPPHLPAALIAGQDVRPGGEPLPARTVAEIHLWLDLMGARQDQRSHVLRQTATGLVAVYEAWWGYDPRQMAFTLVSPTSDPLDLGDGPSQILCAGLLLQYARGKLAGLPRFRWQTNSDQQRRASQALRVLQELEKLVVGNGIPFTALRTAKGAYLWHLEPETFTATAIQKLRQRAEALAGLT